MKSTSISFRKYSGLLLALCLTSACGDDDAEPTFYVNHTVDASTDAAVRAPSDEDAETGSDADVPTSEATTAPDTSATPDAALVTGSMSSGETRLAEVDGGSSEPDDSTAPVGSQTEVTSMPPDQTTTTDVSIEPVLEDCFRNPQTHFEIINACTDAVKIVKTPNLVGLNEDGSLPPLP